MPQAAPASIAHTPTALAVIKWKKLFGFYLDLDDEHHCTYTLDGNMLLNEDKP